MYKTVVKAANVDFFIGKNQKTIFFLKVRFFY